MDSNDYEQVGQILKVLGHPVRLRIIAGLLENECNVSQIQRELNLPQSTISQHLSVLKSQGILKGTRDGLNICYQVVDPRVRDIMCVLNKPE
jgi:DNA-binding transcriptional ArsR family regulator